MDHEGFRSVRDGWSAKLGARTVRFLACNCWMCTRRRQWWRTGLVTYIEDRHREGVVLIQRGCHGAGSLEALLRVQVHGDFLFTITVQKSDLRISIERLKVEEVVIVPEVLILLEVVVADPNLGKS